MAGTNSLCHNLINATSVQGSWAGLVNLVLLDILEMAVIWTDS
jgi:hypothetical protein